MIDCKYWKESWGKSFAGRCSAPDDVSTNATNSRHCMSPQTCPYLLEPLYKKKSQMTVEMFGANTPIVPDETIEEWKKQGLLSETPTLPEMIEVNGVKYQRVKEPQKSKTLWERFYDAKWSDSACDEFCEIVEKWISDFSYNTFGNDYDDGYDYALKTLKENLK
jgi:hypothetical protein